MNKYIHDLVMDAKFTAMPYKISMWQNYAEVYGFYCFLQKRKIKNILEIGTYGGGNFYAMCKLSDPDGKKIAIDLPRYLDGIEVNIHALAEDMADLRDKNIATWSKNTYSLKMDSHNQNTFDKVKRILNGEKLDLLFIDADHTHAGSKKDFEMYKDLVADTGIIGFHDINDTDFHRGLNCYVCNTWNEITGYSKKEFNAHESCGGIGVLLKEPPEEVEKEPNLELSYDKDTDKISFIYKEDIPASYDVVIKDYHSDVPIYATHWLHLSKDFVNWVVPLTNFDFYANPYAGAFKVDFYAPGTKNYLFTRVCKIKDTVAKPDRPKFAWIDEFDCIYVNYEEFFLHDVYSMFDLQDMKTVVDVGANVGMFTNYMIRKGARNIYCLEPSNSAFKKLTTLPFKDHYVRYYKKAMASKTEIRKFATRDDWTTVDKLVRDGEDVSAYQIVDVDCITFKDFLQESGVLSVSPTISLLKMDIEGAEYEVFGQMSDADILTVDRYLVEFHINSDGRAKKVTQRLRDLGYSVMVKKQAAWFTEPNIEDQAQFVMFAQKKLGEIPQSVAGEKPFPKEAIISFATENYLPIADRLAKSVSEFSSMPMVLYSVNCDVPFKYPNLYTRRVDIDGFSLPKFITDKTYTTRKHGDYDVNVKMPDDSVGIVDRSDLNTYITLTIKPTIILNAISDGVEKGFFLDADGLIKENFDTLKEYFDTSEDYPLVGKGLFEYIMLYGKGDPAVGPCLEQPLMNKLGIKGRSMHYCSTNVILFTSKMTPFLEEWKSLSRDADILKENLLYAPYHDETLINVLLWKKGAIKQLPVVHYNLIDSTKVDEFYTTDKRGHIDSEWQFIPDNKDDIKYFHGCKSPIELDKTLEYMQNRKSNCYKYFPVEKSDIAIVTLFDKNYAELGKYSIENKKRYAKKHGYHLIWFEDILDKTRPPQWSKILAVQQVLKNYRWVWWIDIDAMIVNYDIKLESIIDEKYSMIYTKNKWSYISNGSSFFKNSELTFNFLDSCYTQNVDVQTFDHEQKAMRALLQNSSGFADATKLIPERVCNSFWYTEDVSVLSSYPEWNQMDNIYQLGDFIIQFCGRKYEERIPFAKMMEEIDCKGEELGSVKFIAIDTTDSGKVKPLEMPTEEFWNKVYRDNLFGWWGAESKSGAGSEGENAAKKMNVLSECVYKYGCKKILDIGCGDFNWIRSISNNLDLYYGIDIMRDLVKYLKMRFGSSKIQFDYADIAAHDCQVGLSEKVQSVDLIVLLDILGHMTNTEINSTAEFLFKSGKIKSKYILASNCLGSRENYHEDKIYRNESIDLGNHPIAKEHLKIVKHFDVAGGNFVITLYEVI